LPGNPTDMPPWLPDALVATLCAASAAVWYVRLGRRPVAAAALTPGVDNGNPSVQIPVVPPGAIVFAALWVLYHLLGDLTAIVQNAEPPTFDAERTLQALQQNCWLLGAGTGVAWMLLTRGEHENLRAFGVRRRGLAGQIRDGLTTVTAAWLPVFAALFITLPIRTADRRHSVFQLLDADASLAIYAWAVLAAVVVAPLFEELVFRVILQTWLERIIGRAALPVAAVLFAAVHRFPDSLAIIPLALVLGAAYQSRRSYLEIVAAHAAFNAVMLALDSIMPDQ
jgi:membrane protease YdiL (CAAX protease family)